MSVHIRRLEDAQGDLVDLAYFCFDWCHREWCTQNGVDYQGWDGCHELEDLQQRCASCGDLLGIELSDDDE